MNRPGRGTQLIDHARIRSSGRFRVGRRADAAPCCRWTDAWRQTGCGSEGLGVDVWASTPIAARPAADLLHERCWPTQVCLGIVRAVIGLQEVRRERSTPSRRRWCSMRSVLTTTISVLRGF